MAAAGVAHVTVTPAQRKKNEVHDAVMLIVVNLCVSVSYYYEHYLIIKEFSFIMG